MIRFSGCRDRPPGGALERGLDVVSFNLLKRIFPELVGWGMFCYVRTC